MTVCYLLKADKFQTSSIRIIVFVVVISMMWCHVALISF